MDKCEGGAIYQGLDTLHLEGKGDKTEKTQAESLAASGRGIYMG